MSRDQTCAVVNNSPGVGSRDRRREAAIVKGAFHERLRGRLPVTVLLLALLCLSIGCQRATQRIDRHQARIETLSRQTIAELGESRGCIAAALETREIQRESHRLLLQSLDHQQTAILHQQAILRAAGGTRSLLPVVEDKVHPLVRLAQTWGSAALILAVIALLAYLGIGPLIRRGLQLFGLLIPRAVLSDAKFDAEAVERGEACALDYQRIAARRAADRCYDRAFRRAKNRSMER